MRKLIRFIISKFKKKEEEEEFWDGRIGPGVICRIKPGVEVEPPNKEYKYEIHSDSSKQ